MKTILILILVVLIVGVLIEGFYVWENYQKDKLINQKYKIICNNYLNKTDCINASCIWISSSNKCDSPVINGK
jgi:uncharacterized protein YxeA